MTVLFWWSHGRRLLSEWLSALMTLFQRRKSVTTRQHGFFGGANADHCSLKDLMETIQFHRQDHFRLYIDCDDLATLKDCHSFLDQWKRAWKGNTYITRVTITITTSTPTAAPTPTQNNPLDMKTRLNQILLQVGHLPHLKEICLSDICEDEDVYVFPIWIVTQWLQQAKQMEKIKFYMAHLSLTTVTPDQQDLVEPLAQQLQNHPSLSCLEFDHCTYSTHNPLLVNQDKLYQAFVQSAKRNWNIRRIAIQSSCCRRHSLQDSMDYHCKLNRQRKQWFQTLYHQHRHQHQHEHQPLQRILEQLPTSDLDSLYYYLLKVNPIFIHCGI
ncbi:expressed unknown protein [Seminavis robusta]|uniref:Uncharacterized protein n=1 Tax=Seminavis robusta TaxID=568900 RepID=A0A9N8D9N7_9STRA|nr:expressed unknown protein [Seminavis robusta]|eukprot:Sro9_g007650.1 n/a (327) ;mRNA; r:208036-209016